MSVVSTQSKRAGQRPTSSLSATHEGPTSADIVSTSSRQRQSKKDEVDFIISFFFSFFTKQYNKIKIKMSEKK